MPMAPTDSFGMLSNCDFQWLPPSVDFQRPPVAKPMYNNIGSFAEPWMSSRRPIITAGPMDRNSKPRKRGSVDWLGFGAAGRVATCAHKRPAIPREPAATGNRTRREKRKLNAID